MRVISDLLARVVRHRPEAIALVERERRIRYRDLDDQATRTAAALASLGLSRLARVAVYLDKTTECVLTLLGAWRAGFIAVPVNAKLRPAQVAHILTDSGASVLVTTSHRLRDLAGSVETAHLHVVLTDGPRAGDSAAARAIGWSEWLAEAPLPSPWHVIDADPAALMYTSGSTGMPKGVVVTHANLVAGCESVNGYLHTSSEDVILALLPLSFDAGLSQLTTSIEAGACLVLHTYLMARDVPAVCARERVTSITAVPPLWLQLADVDWPEAAAKSLRLFANTGGHMPRTLLGRLRRLFTNAKPYLMYGLTEAFRSTYLDPSEVDRKPDSMGKAIPNCEILVLRPDGSLCNDDEPGELVHRGAHVALGYWNDAARTAERFRPLPSTVAGGLVTQFAVWSGDVVRRDSEGFLFYIGRRDEQIKVSGYRVSPSEIETVFGAHPGVSEVVVFGVPDEQLGQVPVAAVATGSASIDASHLSEFCTRQLPSYMVPRIVMYDTLPRTPNGKFDRHALRQSYFEQLNAPTGNLR